MDSRRQLKISSLLQQEFSSVLLHEGRNIFGQALVTITRVHVTPDLSIARFHFSVFNTEDKQAVIDSLQVHLPELRKKLGEKMRFHLRKIPDLQFFLDETLDHVFRMEEIFKTLHQDSPDNPPQ